MTPRLNLAGVVTACQRPNCRSGSGVLHRHHMGCEHMFVKHFAARTQSKRYAAFKARYEGFWKRDIVILCDECHFWIHVLYGPTIQTHRARVRKRLSDWTWDEACALVKDLRKLCRRWLRRPEDYTVQSRRAASTVSSEVLFNIPSTRDRHASLRRISEAGSSDDPERVARDKALNGCRFRDHW